MLQTVKAAALCGCVVLMITSCKPDDKQVAKAVTSAASAIAPNVTATVNDGIVTLSGVVPDNAAKSSLDSTVKKLNGVVSVVDSTSVESSLSAAASNGLSEPPPPPPPAPARAGTPYTMSSSDILEEKELAMSYKSFHISGVKASVADDIVTLTGNASKKDLRLILEIAGQHRPKGVINKLTVK